MPKTEKVDDRPVVRRPKRLSLTEYVKKMRDKGFNDAGRFIPDSVPVAPPIGYKRQPSMVEIVRDMVRSEHLADAARRSGMETFEESEDFDVGDDPDDLRSGFENDFDPPIEEVKEEVAKSRKKPEDPLLVRAREQVDLEEAVEKVKSKRKGTKPDAG